MRAGATVLASALAFGTAAGAAQALVNGPTGPVSGPGLNGIVAPDMRGVSVNATDLAAVGVTLFGGATGLDLVTFGFADGSGSRGVCLDASKLTPDAQNYVATEYDPVGNALLARYVQPGNHDDGLNAAAAYAFGVNLGHNSNSGELQRESSYISLVHGAAGDTARWAVNNASSLVTEAQKFVGPYHIDVRLTPAANAHGSSGNTDSGFFGVTSAAGARWPNAPVTLTLTGTSGAVWEATGTNQLSFTTDGNGNMPAWNDRWHATRSGTTGVTASTNGDVVPDTSFNVFNSSVTSYQRTAGARLVPASGADALLYDSVVVDLNIATQVSAAVALPGQAVTENFSGTLKGATGETDYKAETVVYGPFTTQPARSAQIPATAPVVTKISSTGKTAADGSYTGQVNWTPKTGGYYTHVTTATATTQGVTLTATHDFGMVEESVAVPAPTLGTQANMQQAMPGDEGFDNLKVGGQILSTAPDGSTITYTLTGGLYGPRQTNSTNPDDWKEATLVAPLNPMPITKTGDYKVGKYTFTASGYYSWGEKLVVTWNGKTVGVIDHKPGDKQQTTVARNPYMKTQAINPTIQPGDHFSDKIQSFDLGEGNTADIKATIWGTITDISEEQCHAMTVDEWAKAIQDGKAKALETVTVTVKGDGVVEAVSTVTATTVGCTTWSEEATSPQFPGHNWHTKPGEKGESQFVRKPPTPPIPTALGIGSDTLPYAAGSAAATIVAAVMGGLLFRRQELDLA